MKEYIEREKAVGIAHGYCHTTDGRCCGPDDVVELYEELKSIPAADVVERKRGKWILSVYTVGIPDIHRWHEWHCSNCGYVRKAGWEHTEDGRKPKAKYCENCCSKMDGGANDV